MSKKLTQYINNQAFSHERMYDNRQSTIQAIQDFGARRLTHQLCDIPIKRFVYGQWALVAYKWIYNCILLAAPCGLTYVMINTRTVHNF